MIPILSDILHKVAGFDQEEVRPYGERPSNATLGERCIRADVYHCGGIPRAPLPGRAIVVMDDSSFHEDLTGDLIRRSAFRLHSEQMGVDIMEIPWIDTDKTWICDICKQQRSARILHGHIDGIILDPLQHDHLLEHKALSFLTFNRYLDGEIPLDYLAQMYLYDKGLQFLVPGLTEGILLTKNKNTSAYLEHQISFDILNDRLIVHRMVASSGDILELNHTESKVCERIMERWMKIRKFTSDKILPRRQYEIDHWRCSYCGWNRACWENWSEELQKRRIVVPLPEHLVSKLSRYIELGKAAKQRDAIGKELKESLEDLEAKGGVGFTIDRLGKVGGFSLMLRRENYSYLNREKIPQQILLDATETRNKTVLRVNVYDPQKSKDAALREAVEAAGFKDMETIESKITVPRKVEL